MSNPNQAYFDKYIDPTVREIDRVNIYEFERGMDYELIQLGGIVDVEHIKKAQQKVLKNLKKDPSYYTNQLASDSVKLVGEYGSGKKPGKKNTPKDAENTKADGKMPKADKQDAPYGGKETVKGKYKSSGMEPAKNNKQYSHTKKPLNENAIHDLLMNIGMDKAEIVDLLQSIQAAIPPTLKTAPLATILAWMASKEKDSDVGRITKEAMDYTISNQSTETDPADYDAGTLKSFEAHSGSDKDTIASMRRQVANKVKGGDFTRPKGTIQTTPPAAPDKPVKSSGEMDEHYLDWKSPEMKKLMNKPQDVLGNRAPGKISDPNFRQDYKDIVNKTGRLGKSWSNVGPKGHLPEMINVKDDRKFYITRENAEMLKKMVQEALFQNKTNPSQIVSAVPGKGIAADPEFSSKFKRTQ